MFRVRSPQLVRSILSAAAVNWSDNLVPRSPLCFMILSRALRWHSTRSACFGTLTDKRSYIEHYPVPPCLSSPPCELHCLLRLATMSTLFVVFALLRLCGAVMIYLVLRTIYRLTIHPLAGFPGPRLAALTSMYAGSYDIPYGSSFCKELPGLHEKYGPIVRILPNQLHVRDMDSFNQ